MEKKGKGIHLARTQGNMLSSQAMCLNVFAPLDTPEGREVLGRVLGKFVGEMGTIQNILFEHTPSPDVFGDQSGVVGVDCDLLIEFGTKNTLTGVLGIETKFVEESFSCCGFNKADAKTKCPADVALDAGRSGCLYTSKKKYLYWARSDEYRTLRPEAISASGCPFAGQMWQLWVNHTLVQVEARRNNAARGVFAVCAPSGNVALMGAGVLAKFGSMLSDPKSFAFIPLEQLIGELAQALAGKPQWSDWVDGVKARYVISGNLASV